LWAIEARVRWGLASLPTTTADRAALVWVTVWATAVYVGDCGLWARLDFANLEGVSHSCWWVRSSHCLLSFGKSCESDCLP